MKKWTSEQKHWDEKYNNWTDNILYILCLQIVCRTGKVFKKNVLTVRLFGLTTTTTVLLLF